MSKKKSSDNTRNKPEKKQPAMQSHNDKSLTGNSPSFLVGIGASAGGLEALEQFFKNMNPRSGLAFVVVQHLSPDYKSLMVELLSKHTQMKVIRAEDGMQIEPDCIYLIPPKKNMTIFHGKLFLTEQDHHHIINLPIDIFFRSLAEDQGDKAIGIILSGTGSDGTLGIRAIKGNGGMVMAQDDHSAKFDGMPRSAIATGLVDYILSADKMPEELLKFVKHPLTAKEAESAGSTEFENSMGKILSIIRNNTGVDFTYYKPNTIIRRLERRITINQIDSYENYVSLLEQSLKEVNILYKELLIGVTKFFRDKESFDILEKQVIPALLKNKKEDEPIRMWSVGCSTGEEAYSLAILLKEHMDQKGLTNDIKIFATDLDKESIEYGSMGFYPESIVADITTERLKAFFIKKDKGYQVRESIRKMVIFATHNIIKDPPFSKIDLISCRNMLIYLKPVMQKKVLSMFHFSLVKNGYLFLGSSESLGDLSKSFDAINTKWKIYAFKDGFENYGQNDFLIPNLSKNMGIPHTSEKPMLPLPHTGSHITETIYNSLIDEFIPPSVIIDEKHEIVHVCKDVNKFVKLPTGKISFDIFSLIRKELSTSVSIAVHKALKENKEIIYSDIRIKENNTFLHLNIKVKPLKEKIKSKQLFVILFEEIKTENATEKTPDEQIINYDTSQQIRDLELELKYTKENLQATIEELGTSNEELQATNEELISSNEELQSTNEELQSVNEELYTVNSEYQNKIDVLTQLNNDINNLLKNTNIGTVFLDRNLLIRKYTPAVTAAINILEMDIGRPIHHISHNTFYENFIEDIENVLRTLVSKEVEIKGKKNNWFLMRILPYRTLENAIDGVVITFFDITERKKFEEQIERKNNLLISVLDNSPIANTILDKKGKITYANHMAEKVLGLTKDEITRREFNAPKWKITDENGEPFPEKELPFVRVINSGKPAFDVVHRIEWPDGTGKTLSINGSPIFDESGNTDGVVCTLLDITEKRKLEEKIKRENDLFIRILENSPNAKLMTDRNGQITFANKLAQELLGIENAQISRKGIFFKDLELKETESYEGYSSIVEKVIKSGKTAYNQRHQIWKNKSIAETVYITASPSFGENKKVEGVVMAFEKHSELIINFDLMADQISAISKDANQGIITLDINSIVTSWNSKAEELTGIKSDQILGKKCFAKSKNGKQELICLGPGRNNEPVTCLEITVKIGQKTFDFSLDRLNIIKNDKNQVFGAVGYF